MRTKTQEEFLSLIRYEIAGTPLPEEFAVSDESALLKLSELQDLTHLVYDALQKNNIPCKNPKYMSQYFAALWRVEQMDYELGRMSELFEENGIDYIPLKGSVMRDLYPERWMRTSADIDILLRPEQEEAAETLLMNRLGYEQDFENAYVHHASFFPPENHVHIEPHRMLFHESHTDRYEDVFRNIWERALPDPDGTKHRYILSDVDVYSYHLAHMEKHFHQAGGCSVRGLIDLWLMEKIPGADIESRKNRINECRISTFEEKMCGLINSWMKALPAENEDLEQFILEGYLYGNPVRRAELTTIKRGKLGYIINRAFLPRIQMEGLFPVLKRHPWLLPVMWPVRWVKRVTDKNSRSRMKTQLKGSLSADEETLERVRRISEYLDIN